jgi:hypothetical protein
VGQIEISYLKLSLNDKGQKFSKGIFDSIISPKDERKFLPKIDPEIK